MEKSIEKLVENMGKDVREKLERDISRCRKKIERIVYFEISIFIITIVLLECFD